MPHTIARGRRSKAEQIDTREAADIAAVRGLVAAALLMPVSGESGICLIMSVPFLMRRHLIFRVRCAVAEFLADQLWHTPAF